MEDESIPAQGDGELSTVGHPTSKLVVLENRLATSKKHEEESLKRLLLLDERLRRLEQLDTRLSQIKAQHSISLPHQISGSPFQNPSDSSTSVAVRGDAALVPHAEFSGISSPDDKDPLRQIVREELESIFSGSQHLDEHHKPHKYDGGRAMLVANLSSSRPQGNDDNNHFDGAKAKVAWGDTLMPDHNSSAENRGINDINPTSFRQSSSANEGTFRSASYKSVQKGGPGAQNSNSMSTHFSSVESRKAHDIDSSNDGLAALEIKEPKTLEEAPAITLAYFFGGFTQQSPVRMKCFQMHRSPRWKAFFILVNLANCLEITLLPEINMSTFNSESRHVSRRATSRVVSVSGTDIFELISIFAIAVEILIGCIALGFIRGKAAWLRCSYFHKIDLAILILAGLEYFLIYSQGILYFSFRAFRLLKLLQPLLSMKMFRDVKEILETLSHGAGQLFTITSVLLLFSLTFSVFGMTMYQGSFRRRCVTTEHFIPSCATQVIDGISSFDIGNCSMAGISWKSISNFSKAGPASVEKGWELVDGGDTVVSGGYPFDRKCKIYYNTSVDQYKGKYPLDPAGKYYHDCGLEAFPKILPEVTCADVENPLRGFIHFDHIGGTIVSIIQYTISDAPYEILWASLESEPDAEPLTWLFYLLITCTSTYLVLGLFLAVIANTFQEVRRSKERGTKERTENAEEGGELTRYQETVNKITEKRRNNEEDVEGEDGAALLASWATSVLQDDRVKHIVSIVIVAHTAAMASSAESTVTAFDKFVPMIFYVANAVFCAEILMRFTATGGSKNFLANDFHILEFALVICGLIGLVTGQRIIKLIPSIRLFRLAHYLPTLQDLLLDAIDTIGAFLNLLLFVSLVSVCFAVAGRYIFRGDMDEVTRSHFGNLGQAMLTIFQLFSGDSWSFVLQEAMSTKTDTGQQFYAALFIISWLLLSKVIFTDLFIAVLIENFEIAETVRLIAEPGRISTFRSRVKSAFQNFRDIIANANAVAAQEVQKPAINIPYIRSTAAASSPETSTMFCASHHQQLLLNAVTCSKKIEITEEILNMSDDLDDKSLFFFGPQHPTRIFCIRLMKNPFFQMVIYAAIFVSCILLMATPPAEDVPDLSGPFPLWVRQACDKILTAIFAVEFIVSVVAQGFLLSKVAYLRNGWNIVDFVILFLSLLDLSGLVKGSLSKICRLGRALRPLRLVKRNKGLRQMMEALFATLPPIAYVLALWTILFTVFAIFGMGIFGGLMFRCSHGAEYPAGKIECSGFEVDLGRGIMLPRAWFNPPYNFDTLYEASLSLFRINTVKYLDILRDGMDVTYRDVSPNENFSPLNSLFVIAYLIVASLFVMNVFVAFIVDGFNLNRGASPVDVSYNKFLRQIESYAPQEQKFRPPKNDFSKLFRRLAESRQFKTFSLACVGCNVGLMLADHADASDSFEALMNAQNLLFFMELVVEVVINLIAYGPGGFYDDTWKFFDLIVMMGSGIGYISSSLVLEKASKAFRLFRVIRLMRMIKAIRSILETMLSSIPQFGNIILLLFLVYSMFATLFVQLFGLTKYGKRLGPTARFDTFSHAIVTCYQLIIQDEWMIIMDDVSIQWPSCTEAFDSKYIHGYDGPQYSWGDCGKTWARYPFVAFKLICESILLNLFIGVILEKFGFITDEISHKEDRTWTSGASGPQFVNFVKSFETFAAGTHLISIHAASSTLLFTQKVPLGFRTYSGEIEYEEVERAAQKMIRAELNVILRLKYLNYARFRQRWRLLSPILNVQRKISSYQSRFINGVSFEDVARTFLYWRKPTLTPESVKLLRHQRIEEVLVMKAALVIVDFFRGLVARRVHAETTKQLSGLMRMMRWTRSDTHFMRRSQHYATIRTDIDALVASRRLKTAKKLLSSPTKIMSVEMMRVPALDENMESHDDAVRNKIKVPRPKHGLETFRKGASNHLVIARFVDPTNEGVVCLDIRQWEWLGWKAFHEEHDSYLSADRLSPVGREAAIWDNLELVMSAENSEDSLVWELLDVHCFFNDNGIGDGLNSVVRIHLGYNTATESLEQRETNVAGVLEVLGYTSTEKPAEPAMFLSPRRMSPRRFSPSRPSPARHPTSLSR